MRQQTRRETEAGQAQGAGQRRGRLLLALVLHPLALLGSAGCANLWDDVTSRDFEVRSLFVKPHPLDVLAQSKDGDKRARALRALREPSQQGGSSAEQDQVVKLLVDTAVSDPRPLCRIAAIETLGRFKDPRATQGLIDAYYAVTEQRADAGTAAGIDRSISLTGGGDRVSTFSADLVTMIQCQAMTSLGQTGNPMAVELLTTVAREPRSEGQNKQQATDVRIAATRALGRFRHFQATETLVHVLATEKDVALRDAAHESLQAATGKKLPADAKAWEEMLHQSGDRATTSGSSSALQRVGLTLPGRWDSAPSSGALPDAISSSERR